MLLGQEISAVGVELNYLGIFNLGVIGLTPGIAISSEERSGVVENYFFFSVLFYLISKIVRRWIIC